MTPRHGRDVAFSNLRGLKYRVTFRPSFCTMADMNRPQPAIPPAPPPQRPEPSALGDKARAAAASLKANPHDENTHKALTGRLYVWDGEPATVPEVPDSMMGR